MLFEVAGVVGMSRGLGLRGMFRTVEAGRKMPSNPTSFATVAQDSTDKQAGERVAELRKLRAALTPSRMWHHYASVTGNRHGGTCTRWIAALSAAPFR